jgi:outer membrane scaffolding protein for murein synthesis (MipA/OmpV family)
MNNFFGVSDTDAALSGLESIDLEGGYRSTGLSLIYRENISENMQVVASTGVESYSRDIDKSELVTDALETNSELSLLWMF